MAFEQLSFSEQRYFDGRFRKSIDYDDVAYLFAVAAPALAATPASAEEFSPHEEFRPHCDPCARSSD
jgi:hypothetical protein